MGKLMIGSFGTLAAVAVLNFQLQPMPEVDRLFLLRFDSLDSAIAARDKVLKSVLQPASIDLLNPMAAAIVGWTGYVLAIQAGGNGAVIDRYEKELRELGGLQISDTASPLPEFTPWYLATHENAAVARISCTLSQLHGTIEGLNAPVVARAGSGVCYAYFDKAEAAAEAVGRTHNAIIEFAPEDRKPKLNLWPAPGPDFEIMKRIKHMFDPERLLNRGRLYRQL
jgi:glycolate oxidase FAD binding subunit